MKFGYIQLFTLRLKTLLIKYFSFYINLRKFKFKIINQKYFHFF